MISNCLWIKEWILLFYFSLDLECCYDVENNYLNGVNFETNAFVPLKIVGNEGIFEDSWI